MAASLFGLSASAQVLITDAEYLSRRTERVETRAARNSADLKRMDSIVMSKGYRFVPDQFQQMPAGVAHTIYNPNFMLTVNRRMWTSTCRISRTPLQVPPSSLRSMR